MHGLVRGLPLSSLLLLTSQCQLMITELGCPTVPIVICSYTYRVAQALVLLIVLLLH